MARAEQASRTVAENPRFRNPRKWRDVVERTFPGALGRLGTSMGDTLPVPLRATFEDATTPTKNSGRITRFRETFKTWEKVLDHIGLSPKKRKSAFGPMMEQIINYGVNPEFSKNGGLPGVVAIRVVSCPFNFFDRVVRESLSDLGFDMSYFDRVPMLHEDGVSRDVVDARFLWDQAHDYI